jgi:hypothetical protein
VNCQFHSELAIGPGLYQHIFEKANVYIQGAVGPVDEEDLYYIPVEPAHVYNARRVPRDWADHDGEPGGPGGDRGAD